MEKIWEAQLDNRYDCTVERLDAYQGLLKVQDTQENRTLLEEHVSLAYGAQFGPDIDDVRTWEDKCVEIVDGK